MQGRDHTSFSLALSLTDEQVLSTVRTETEAGANAEADDAKSRDRTAAAAVFILFVVTLVERVGWWILFQEDRVQGGSGDAH